MMPSLDEKAFAALYEQGAPFLLRTTLIGDLETPVSAFLKLKQGRTSPLFLLESVEGGAVRGRYSMIGLDPDLIWRCEKGEASLNREANFNRDALQDQAAFAPENIPPLASLRRLIQESRIAHDTDFPPMAAGLFGYLGYDMVRLIEKLSSANDDVLHVPDAILMRPTMMVVFDAVRDEIGLSIPVRPRGGLSAMLAYEQALTRFDSITDALDQPLPHEARLEGFGAHPVPQVVSNTTPDEYLAMVARAQDYIKAGDIFQVVLSQRFEADFALPPFALYRALRRVNPAPFLCYLDWGGFQIVCSSPEILVRLRDNTVTIRPIAGTRPRGKTASEDKAFADDLLNDPKERAEHLMLLDLGRNDVGRVSELGSVTVTDSFFLEYYSQVMHIVSNVEGRIDPRRDALDALMAGFPAGTVSGAPKVRAMQIIDELEKHKRGVYGGCIGYFGANGEMDSCIVLRTAIIKDQRMYVQAGAGIVYDSQPSSEQQECINKAKALFRAAEEAVRFASQSKKGQ
jgi:anthranilate synthase component I